MSSIIARRLAGRIAGLSTKGQGAKEEAESIKNLWQNLNNGARNGQTPAPLTDLSDNSNNNEEYHFKTPSIPAAAAAAAAASVAKPAAPRVLPPRAPAPAQSAPKPVPAAAHLAPGALAASKDINRKIVQAHDVRGVLRVLESLRQNIHFNGVNCSTALHRLAKLAQDSTAQAALSPADRHQLSQELVVLNQLVVDRVHELDAQGLSNTLWANATMKRVLGAEALKAVARAVEVHPAKVNPLVAAAASAPMSASAVGAARRPADAGGLAARLNPSAKAFNPEPSAKVAGAAVVAGVALASASAAAEAPPPPAAEDLASLETVLALQKAGIKVAPGKTSKVAAAAPHPAVSTPASSPGPASVSSAASASSGYSDASDAVELLGSDLWSEIDSACANTTGLGSLPSAVPGPLILALAAALEQTPTAAAHVAIPAPTWLGGSAAAAVSPASLLLSTPSSGAHSLLALASSNEGPEQIAHRFLSKRQAALPPVATVVDETDDVATAQGGPIVWDVLVTEIDKKMDQFVPQAFANTLWALSTLDYRPQPAFLDRLLRAAEVQIPDFAPQHLSISVYSCGTLQHPPSARFLQAVVRRSEACLDQFKCQEIANLVFGCARLGRYDGPLLERVAGACLAKIHQFNRSQNISNVLWAFATLKFHPGPALMSRFEEEAVRHLAEYKPKEIANLVWAFGVLGEPCPRLLQGVQAEVCGRHRWLAEMKQPELANFLHGLALLDAAGPVWAALLTALQANPSAMHGFLAEELRQLYHAGLLCELSMPGALLALPPSLLQRAQDAWTAAVRAAPRSSSELHRDISRVLSLLGLEHLNDFVTADGTLSLDILLPGLNVVLEANGPSHFLANNVHRPLGSTLARARLIAAQGFFLIHVPITSWSLLPNDDAKSLFLLNTIDSTIAAAHSARAAPVTDPSWLALQMA